MAAFSFTGFILIQFLYSEAGRLKSNVDQSQADGKAMLVITGICSLQNDRYISIASNEVEWSGYPVCVIIVRMSCTRDFQRSVPEILRIGQT